MDARTSRRHFLYGGAVAGAGIWLPLDVREADARAHHKAPLARGGTFADGVMSGDPSPTGVTLWTRLDGNARDRLRVELEVARDPDFRHVVLRRLVPTTAARDHTVKVRVGGLKPDRRYHYRFATRTTHSPVGRTQTAPAPDSRRTVKVGYFACQDFSSGYFGAYQALLALDPDVVVCGGDYIYDRVYDTDGYGGVREDKIGANGDSVARVVGDYRAKYRQARTDADLRELHRLVPLVPQWDDHEVTDNYVGTLAESAADDGDERDAYDRARIRAGWKAWHEYMPARRFGKGFRTYRKLQFGRTAELFMLDSRSYREDQPCGGGSLQQCDDDAPRQYLGKRQLGWLKHGLESSGASWRLIGNQLMIMPFEVAAGTKVEVDSWQGYPAQRTELLTHIETQKIPDVVFLTGDIHTFFAGSVLRDGKSGPAVASELVGGSTTSPGTAQVIAHTAGGVLPPDLVEPLSDEGVPRLNPWMSYADTRTHGCAFLELGRTEVRARYLGSTDVTTLDGSREVREIADLRIARGTPGVNVQSRS
ncbi:MAG: alkaline phosphatase [Solirubrobacteraceae bacterium]|nr:alkaline phosphatase [Solirubrobacteraceae bacterium]